MKSLRLMLCAMPLMLTGCSTMSSVNWSAANPWNWFGSSTKVSEQGVGELTASCALYAYCREMIMLRFLNQCSQGRGAWLLMAFTALALELTALWFQHVMLLKPCVLCIYERCALFGVLGAALIGAIAPKTPLRYVAMVIWLYSAFRGVQLTYEHTMLQLYPSPFATCDFMVRFPEWLPLDKWVPQVFVASGDCAERQWDFLGMEMPQWLLGIFIAYLIVAVLVVISQPFKAKKRDLFGR